jgi:hypothetical protein
MPDGRPAGGAELQPRITADGSFSLFSTAFREGFHSADGAVEEARRKFVEPADLARFPPGHVLWVVDVCVGLGTNTAVLLERALALGLRLRWFGLEIDPRPLDLALAEPAFLDRCGAASLEALRQLRDTGRWRTAAGEGEWFLGDARERLGRLPPSTSGRCDLVLLDAFSPRRCPQLWTLEFLSGLASLLNPQGRLLTYCSAAAVRRSLERTGLWLASPAEDGNGLGQWSLGTVASPSALPFGGTVRPLSAMEREHIESRAGEPYRDPDGSATAARILAAREAAQRQSGDASAGAWRRRWRAGVGGGGDGR